MNSSEVKYKICLVSDHLSGGGAERCSALLSVYFTNNNCKVHHVIVQDKIEYEYAGEVLNLGKLKKGGFNIADRIKRFQKLHRFFRDNKFDFIIDTRARNRQWQEYILFKYVFNAPTIVVVHSFMMEMYFPKSSFLARTIFNKCASIISVSEEINKKIRSQFGYQKVTTIYNPIDINHIEQKSSEPLATDFDYILAVGNMEFAVKQYDHLLKCYKDSNLPSQKIKLVIIGEGQLREQYEKMSRDLNLEHQVVFKGALQNPFPYYKKALFTVLTSKNEGFPTVLLESLACATPVVAYDCQSGPSEILLNEGNGLLVDNQNQEQFTEALNAMISNKELYLHCKSNAKSSVERFSLENIGAQWLQLFKSIKNEY